MMLHRHFEAVRAEAEKPKPVPAPAAKIIPAKDVAEGEDIVETKPQTRSTRRKGK